MKFVPSKFVSFLIYIPLITSSPYILYLVIYSSFIHVFIYLFYSILIVSFILLLANYIRVLNTKSNNSILRIFRCETEERIANNFEYFARRAKHSVTHSGCKRRRILGVCISRRPRNRWNILRDRHFLSFPFSFCIIKKNENKQTKNKRKIESTPSFPPSIYFSRREIAEIIRVEIIRPLSKFILLKNAICNSYDCLSVYTRRAGKYNSASYLAPPQGFKWNSVDYIIWGLLGWVLSFQYSYNKSVAW